MLLIILSVLNKQGKSESGLESQQASVEQYINHHWGKFPDSFTEDESGKRYDRLKLDKAIICWQVPHM